MLSLGLTGGIAAGKSLLTNRFRELGAVVVDADQLARDVVAPGTPGLAAVVATFGDRILSPDGSLNRPKLGSVVFADPAARESLNAIVHPRVRAAANALKADAGARAIVVQDIPLLVESGQAAGFHLVVVVQAPREERIARMVRDRGMSREDALARMAAQASDGQRAAAADVLILNDGSPEAAVAQLDRLWQERLLPFAANLTAERSAPLPAVTGDAGQPDDAGAMERSVDQLVAAQERMAARLAHAVRGVPGAKVTAPPGTAGRLLQFQLDVAGREVANLSTTELAQAMASAGFFPLGSLPAGHADAYGQMEGATAAAASCYASADPGCPALVRIQGSWSGPGPAARRSCTAGP